MKAQCLAVIATACVLSAAVSAAPIINVGSHNLQENATGQIVQLFVESDPAEQVTGFNLRAQIGNANGPSTAEPAFDSVSFAGGIWDAHDATIPPITGLFDPPYAMVAQHNVVFTDTGDTVSANGLLVTLGIDTTGFFATDAITSFPLLLAGSPVIAADSDFAGVAAVITNGTINIVPEPATMSLLVLGGLGVMARRRRNR